MTFVGVADAAPVVGPFGRWALAARRVEDGRAMVTVAVRDTMIAGLLLRGIVSRYYVLDVRMAATRRHRSYQALTATCP